ncbi:MAG TPA: UDP-N-acetylglucosamine 1-carboxyvinyltransferase [Elusimicrobia bacterium]|nr:UDP-N-acetylglucosamine 1-carboxyvinyltransferase [Elusimicrobiota bacterium]
MDKFIIDGGRRLRGTLEVNGSKNAALPILVATLLTDEPCLIDNVPRLRDIRTTVRLLETLGKRVVYRGRTVVVLPARKLRTRAPYDLVKQMRASILVVGPLLARFGKARAALPGGCAIGLRPVDIHLKGFAAMGAKESAEGGDVLLEGRLKPARVRLRFPSVGATENLMMAAAAVSGETLIENAAREPEIEDLGRFLSAMGARVSGAGGSRVRVFGAPRLHGARHRVIPDRIETGTYLLAIAAAGGDVRLVGAEPRHLAALITALKRSGVKLQSVQTEDHRPVLRIRMSGRPRPVSVRTRPHPGFPTDLQAPWMSYMCLARGKSRIREEIFERRFLHAAELTRMGADVQIRSRDAVIQGVPELRGAPVMASDIRAGAALIVAALAAKGESEVHRVYHIDRGYERVERVLRGVGARIRRGTA